MSVHFGEATTPLPGRINIATAGTPRVAGRPQTRSATKKALTPAKKSGAKSKSKTKGKAKGKIKSKSKPSRTKPRTKPRGKAKGKSTTKAKFVIKKSRIVVTLVSGKTKRIGVIALLKKIPPHVLISYVKRHAK